ncbi:hypothetical protein [Chitinophaga filiformis]|uniref:Uncharacterized protein n=1 Tax=Chitinophaga filiformis TaxID=104663 RepID=A0ABY4I1G2_CHIFI|nr:hypothetical protein [Chitinophaga filiformis]UPK69685.1 hypothetical protein MYF79_00090 [Chitinophaga filiformis]
MDPAFIQSYFDRCDKNTIRKIITSAIKAQELPVRIRPIIPQRNPNKNTNNKKSVGR